MQFEEEILRDFTKKKNTYMFCKIFNENKHLSPIRKINFCSFQLLQMKSSDFYHFLLGYRFKNENKTCILHYSVKKRSLIFSKKETFLKKYPELIRYVFIPCIKQYLHDFIQHKKSKTRIFLTHYMRFLTFKRSELFREISD